MQQVLQTPAPARCKEPLAEIRCCHHLDLRFGRSSQCRMEGPTGFPAFLRRDGL